MVSAPHVYRAAKTGSPELLDSLRQDFKDSWMVLGTRLGYSTQDLSGKVTHFYGSTQAQPITLSVGIIPVYQGENLQSVVEGNGLKYMQAFWHTADKPSKIIETIENVSQKAAKDIAVWTPNQSNRVAVPERPAVLRYYYGQFRVDGYGSFGSGVGHSRRVLVGSAQRARKK